MSFRDQPILELSFRRPGFKDLLYIMPVEPDMVKCLEALPKDREKDRMEAQKAILMEGQRRDVVRHLANTLSIGILNRIARQDPVDGPEPKPVEPDDRPHPINFTDLGTQFVRMIAAHPVLMAILKDSGREGYAVAKMIESATRYDELEHPPLDFRKFLSGIEETMTRMGL